MTPLTIVMLPKITVTVLLELLLLLLVPLRL